MFNIYERAAIRFKGGVMEKKQILQQALKKLNTYVSSELKQDFDEDMFSLQSSSAINDGPISLTASETGVTYPVFIQAWAPQKDINALISQIKSMSGKVILFADFVNPVMAEKFRRRGLSFVDCAGNIFLKNEQFNIFVKGKKSSRLRSGRGRVRGRAFNTAGLKLIFAVFNQPQFLNVSYRDISNKINIALGSVGPVIDDLYASGYILDDGERRLVNKKRLYERWVDGYLEKLRPRQIMECYSCDDVNWWKKAEPAEFKGVWGGEVIVAKSTPFMVPESISLYFSSEVKQKDFADYCGLRKDDEGDICVYKSFWSPSYAGDDNIDGLSPMIIYADIVDSINPGSWDVAKTFYGEAIACLLQD